MKIALITDSRNVHAHRWAKSLSEKVDELFVISVANSAIEGCEVFKLNMINFGKNRLKTMINKYRYIVKSWFILLKRKPDIIHVHFLRPDITIFSFLFFRNILISVWGTDITGGSGRFGLKNLYRRIALSKAKSVTATTGFLADQTRKYCRKKNIHIIPFGIDLDLYKPAYKKKKKNIVKIGFVKHLYEIYGPHILIEAMNHIKSEVTVYIAGKGPLRAELENLIQKYGLNNVNLVGHIDNKNIPYFLMDIDIFVMPSLRESFGVSAIEAQAMGIPVISSNIEGVNEAVLDQKTGVLIPPNDPVRLANAIDDLIKDQEKYDYLSSNCRAFVEQSFDWKKNVNSIIELYHKLV